MGVGGGGLHTKTVSTSAVVTYQPSCINSCVPEVSLRVVPSHLCEAMLYSSLPSDLSHQTDDARPSLQLALDSIAAGQKVLWGTRS